MNGGPVVIGIHAEDAPVAETAAADMDESPAYAAPDDIEPQPLWVAIVPILIFALAIGWVAEMLWLARAEIARLDPIALVDFVAALCAVPGLLGIIWMVAARSDKSRAERLFIGAREMRLETESLARITAGLAATIDGKKEMLTGQVRALTTIGESATARLATIGRGLSEEIDQADIHTRALTEAASGAEARVAVLLASLPRAQDETQTLGGMIERVGIGAGEQIAALDARLVALSERGREAEVIASGSAQTLAAHIARMEATSETAGNRLDAVTATMSGQIDALLDRTANAVDESRKGIAAQGDAMLAMVGANQVALDTAARESAEALAERIRIVEHVIDRVTTRLEAQRQAGDDMVSELETWIDRVENRFDTLHNDGTRRTGELATSLAALGDNASSLAASVGKGNGAAVKAIGTAETLLIALDAATREIDETLAGALTRLDARLSTTRQLIGTARPELLALVTASESTHVAVEAVAATIAEQRRDAETVAATLNDGLAAGREKASALDRTVEDAIVRVDRFVEDAAPRLLEALLRVKETASAAADRARETLTSVMPEVAASMETATTTALRKAAGEGVEAQIASVAEVAEAAVAAATRAADRLEQQLARIGETTVLVDTRFEEAREERDAGDRETIARHASLLIESMNSASIDISRSLSPEVSDTAWAAYLKGDRGVFTRRAVRLLDGSDARDIARLYDEDAAFREQVNRYIHDFEAMLRGILAQRDGSPLGVTLLSSDMGKLYVAMAQAIERLR